MSIIRQVASSYSILCYDILASREWIKKTGSKKYVDSWS
jgi:hypothetical protein